MVVEDETQLAGLIGSYLERDGFEVAVVHDGLEAVEAARAVDPDVVVLDDNSPDGTGDLADQIAAQDAHVQVLHRAGKEGQGQQPAADVVHG